MVVVSTLQTANYDVKEKLHREKSAGGELIELSKQFGNEKEARSETSGFREKFSLV